MGKNGCKRNTSCDFSHNLLVCEKQKEKSDMKEKKEPSYKCVSCHSEWQEHRYLVKHNIQNKQVYFCLNCDDWVKHKERVFDHGWSLLDQSGNLNSFV